MSLVSRGGLSAARRVHEGNTVGAFFEADYVGRAWHVRRVYLEHARGRVGTAALTRTPRIASWQ